VGMGNVEVGGGCWGSSDVMGFGLEAWVGGEKGGGGERKMGIFDMLCVLEQKGCLVLLLGMLFVGFCIGMVFGS